MRHRDPLQHPWRVILGRISHAGFGPLSGTLCGRELRGHPVRSNLTAEEAFAATDCKTCRKGFHQSIREYKP